MEYLWLAFVLITKWTVNLNHNIDALNYGMNRLISIHSSYNSEKIFFDERYVRDKSTCKINFWQLLFNNFRPNIQTLKVYLFQTCSSLQRGWLVDVDAFSPKTCLSCIKNDRNYVYTRQIAYTCRKGIDILEVFIYVIDICKHIWICIP